MGAWTSIRSMNSSGEPADHGRVRRSISIEFASPSKRSRTVSSTPHSSILGRSGSSSAYSRPTWNSSCAALPGVHAVMPTVLPGRTTRNISSATTRGRGAIIAPNTDPTHSNRPSSNGSSSASATAHSMSKPSASERLRPFSTIPGARSDATTLAPSRAHSIAKLPSPAATSSTS